MSFKKRVRKLFCKHKFFVPLQFGPRICTEGSISSFWQKGGSHLLVSHCLGLLLSSPIRPNQVQHVGSLIFFSNNFFILQQRRISFIIASRVWQHVVCKGESLLKRKMDTHVWTYSCVARLKREWETEKERKRGGIFDLDASFYMLLGLAPERPLEELFGRKEIYEFTQV